VLFGGGQTLVVGGGDASAGDVLAAALAEGGFATRGVGEQREFVEVLVNHRFQRQVGVGEAAGIVLDLLADAPALPGVGVLLLVAGALLASAAFVLRLLRSVSFNDAYHQLRADLGRAILLGLEFMVISDIIGTVAIKPTPQNLGVLAVIVAIRTLLSFALELEVSGRWPWQKTVH